VPSRETIYLPELDAVLIGARVMVDGKQLWALYDCGKNAWFGVELPGADPIGKGTPVRNGHSHRDSSHVPPPGVFTRRHIRPARLRPTLLLEQPAEEHPFGGLPPDGRNRVDQRNFLGAHLDAVLRFTTAFDAALAHHGVETVGRSRARTE